MRKKCVCADGNEDKTTRKHLGDTIEVQDWLIGDHVGVSSFLKEHRMDTSSNGL